MEKNNFYFATCQTGAEKAVKGEVLSEYPSLRFAFSRPGFITFKSDGADPIPRTHGVFARLWGKSIDQVRGADSVEPLLNQVPRGAILHLFERDEFVPGDEPDALLENARIKKVFSEANESLRSQFQVNAKPAVGETVYDLIWIDDKHYFLGSHLHGIHLDPSPGNKPRIDLPSHSPSRAYLKIEEAFHRFKPKITPGMQVLEVGCSPGGATTAMLTRGLHVTGIDPKRMDEALYEKKGFQFIQKPAGALTMGDLRGVNPDWVVMDMNIAPLEAIDELSHVVGLLRKSHGKAMLLSRGFLTIKLNDWKFAESIPLYLKRLEQLGFKELYATQLCFNRQEFFVFAQRFEA